jgi:WhiB family redox-sensing transcriptional regulator
VIDAVADHVDDRWRAQAACRDVDPDLFFPLGSTGAALAHIAAAKAVCLACPVREDCLEFALATNQDSGIWGGTSEEERRQIRRARSVRGPGPPSRGLVGTP